MLGYPAADSPETPPKGIPKHELDASVPKTIPNLRRLQSRENVSRPEIPPGQVW